MVPLIALQLFNPILYLWFIMHRFKYEIELENLKLNANKRWQSMDGMTNSLQRINQINRRIEIENKFWSKFIWSTMYIHGSIFGLLIALFFQELD